MKLVIINFTTLRERPEIESTHPNIVHQHPNFLPLNSVLDLVINFVASREVDINDSSLNVVGFLNFLRTRFKFRKGS